MCGIEVEQMISANLFAITAKAAAVVKANVSRIR
jgi:hypothetical protein